jgi:hypothetical protein
MEEESVCVTCRPDNPWLNNWELTAFTFNTFLVSFSLNASASKDLNQFK